jgi:hypothetical protein
MFTPRFQAEMEPDPADTYAAAVYGSILVAAFTTVFRQEHAAPQAVAISVLGTMAVFWIAHVWSAVLGERIHRRGRVGLHRTAAIARAEWPLLEAALAPGLVLVLGWIGVIGETRAEDVALAVCVIQLFAWGLVVGLRAYEQWWVAVLSGLANGLLGLAVVGLEIRVVH